MNGPKKKKPWIASILSILMPGLGHIYAGRIKKGVALYLGLILMAFSLRFFAYTFYIFSGIIIAIIFYTLYIIVDAYISVRKNALIGPPKRFDKWYVYGLIITLQLILFEIAPKHILDEISPLIFANIPTTAMNPTLQVGDNITIKKTQGIKQNDIVIFKYPEDPKTMFVKRCIGTPGSTLEIKNGNAYVNNKFVDDPKKLQYLYTVETYGESLNQAIFDKYHINDHFQMDKHSYMLFITESVANNLSNMETVKNVQRTINQDDNSSKLFPKDIINGWTVDNYGPIYIPKKGESIKLTKSTIPIYTSIIQEENKNYVISDSTVQIDKKNVEDYTFKRNYYFVLGDNRHNSLDSRYWGFIKEDYIIGKALYRYWAENSSRIGKQIE